MQAILGLHWGTLLKGYDPGSHDIKPTAAAPLGGLNIAELISKIPGNPQT